MLEQHEISAFLSAAQATVDHDYASFQRACDVKLSGPVLSIEPGRRYARIVSENGQRCAFGFIDLTNGNVLKADGWKGPAKNFARGNISDANQGCGRMRWTGIG